MLSQMLPRLIQRVLACDLDSSMLGPSLGPHEACKACLQVMLDNCFTVSFEDPLIILK